MSDSIDRVIDSSFPLPPSSTRPTQRTECPTTINLQISAEIQPPAQLPPRGPSRHSAANLYYHPQQDFKPNKDVFMTTCCPDDCPTGRDTGTGIVAAPILNSPTSIHLYPNT